jgi:hypothetical protein
MRTWLRSKATLLCVLFAVVLTFPAIALADVVKNDVANDVGVGQIRNYVAGAAPTSVGYYIQPAGDCDPANGTAANVSLQVTEFNNAPLDAAHTGVVTIDPSSLSFTQCDVKQQVMFSTAANAPAGDYKITATATDSGSGDTYNESPATFVLRVTGESSGGGGGGTCTIPATPVFATTSADADGSNGWFKTVPAVSASSTTAGATIEYATEVNGGAKSAYGATAPVLGEGITKVYARAVSGTCSSETTDTFKVDTRLPDLNISGAADGTSYDVCATLNGNGPQRPTFAPSDPTPGSGVTWADANTNGKVDAAEFSTNTFDSWTTPSNAYGLGSYTYNASADDNAGNVQTGSRSYSVVYGDAANGGAFGGFLPPINANGTRSVFKLTSTIPVKFQLTCNGAPLSNAVAYLTVQKVDPNPDGTINEAIATDAATTGNQFRYADGGYHFNLSTKSGYTNPSGQNIPFSAGTWKLIVSLDDHTTRTVVIDLRK